MSYETNKVAWLMESSPEGKFVIRGRHLVFERFSKKSLARLSYLARREKVSVRGYIIRCIMRGINRVK
jgi:hypothetical protein